MRNSERPGPYTFTGDTFKCGPMFAEVERKLSIPEPFTHVELGRQASEFEPELPVTAYREILIDAIATNQVVIVTAETGSGKTTQIPQILAEKGYIPYVTQPRRIAASFAAQQIQKELSVCLGDEAEDLVGCHTAGEKTTVDGKTRITILTDGLRLVQEFGQREVLEHEVLIIDEVHEWNTNIEMLVAQAKRLVEQKPDIRVVIMSATMEVEKFAEFFTLGDKRPPIIEIPGRNFEVTRTEEPKSTVAAEAVKYAKPGEATLIFLPGVREIQDTMSAIKKSLEEKGITDAIVLPLHSKLSKAEQEAVKSLYPGPKIICATNIAQTSITITDVNRVIMSGLERRTEIDDEGVHSLNLRPVSRADLMQQSGRCGRVENGDAILTRLNDDMDFISQNSADRTDYPIPEILRTDVARNTLLTSASDLDFDEFELFHPVETTVIKRAKQELRTLGAFDEQNLITDLGRRMIKFPMRPIYSRMMTYAEDEKYSANVQAYLAATVSAMEVGGLPSWLRDSSKDWLAETEETDDSDHLSQLRLFIAAQSMSNKEKIEIGLDENNVARAQELYRKVCRRTGIQIDTRLAPPTNEELIQVRSAITAGLIGHVYEKSGKGYTRAGVRDELPREKGNRTTVIGLPSVVVATPYNVEVRKRLGTYERRIVQDITAVTVAQLGSIATHLCEWEAAELIWRGGRLKRVQNELFRSIPTGTQRETEAEAAPEVIKEVERYVLTHTGSAVTELKEIKKELEVLQRLTTETLPMITQDQLEQIIRDAMNHGEILDPSYIDYTVRGVMDEMGFSLDKLISPAARQEIYDKAPLFITVGDVELRLIYKKGIPYHNISDPNVAIGWHEEPRLPDGRIIKLLYKRKENTVKKLQLLAQQLA